MITRCTSRCSWLACPSRPGSRRSSFGISGTPPASTAVSRRLVLCLEKGSFSDTCASDSMKSATSLIVWILWLYTIIIIPGVHKRQYTRLVCHIIITISLLLIMMIIVTRCTSTASWLTSCKQQKAVTRLLLAATCTRWEITKQKSITGKTFFGAKCNGMFSCQF